MTAKTAMESLGISIQEVSENRAVATMTVDGRHLQSMGILHGGISLVLAETVASVMAWAGVDQEKSYVVGQEINANHIQMVKPETELTATATLLHRGKQSVVANIDITDDMDGLICVSRCTLAILDKPN